MQPHYNVQFLCTGNSARSIMAEAIMNFKGKPRFTAYSAGSHPSGKVRPEALRLLQASGIPIDGLRSKSWDEFSRPDAPRFDFILTVCDNAANEVCPLYTSRSRTAKGDANTGGDARGPTTSSGTSSTTSSEPMVAHWGVPDPAAVHGSPDEIERAFRDAFTVLERRIDLFLSLPLASIDEMALKRSVEEIGQK